MLAGNGWNGYGVPIRIVKLLASDRHFQDPKIILQGSSGMEAPSADHAVLRVESSDFNGLPVGDRTPSNWTLNLKDFQHELGCRH